jgi:misacylated tRNA(Ala) deacylase
MESLDREGETGQLPATARLYWEDDHCFEADARVIGLRASALAFDRSCFYPGGGGQPADSGWVRLADGTELAIVTIEAAPDAVLWHIASAPPPPGALGQAARLLLDRPRRLALARYHTVLHVVNTIALRDYAGWITGVQIGTDYSRIDFKIEGFSAALCTELESKVNAVLARNHAVRAYYLPEGEFRRRGDLLRTLEVAPPVVDGRVRVVEIQGFDAQACGGTHVSATGELGRLSIFRTENKGRINKRLYVRLEQPGEGA